MNEIDKMLQLGLASINNLGNTLLFFWNMNYYAVHTSQLHSTTTFNNDSDNIKWRYGTTELLLKIDFLLKMSLPVSVFMLFEIQMSTL